MENTYQDLITDIQSKNPKISGKLEGGKKFKIKSDFKPAGDQPEAIKKLVNGANKEEFNQVLLGVTGSGKTFTMAKVIEATNRPTLILAPNKTLAAQLYGEMKTFFPDNAVEYFVSYYDYYTPEAYVPRSDTYIEKEASINEQIDRMRHSATRSLLERDDVLIVASVSCIYGLGSVEAYSKMTLTLQKNFDYNREHIIKSLVAALKKYPNFNSSIDQINEGKISLKKYFHIGIAVDTEHGLMVPKIRNVNEKNLNHISLELKDISDKCRKLKIDKKEFFGGSMTITSLGGIGGSFFTPIINYPEVAILGVGRSYYKQVLIDNQFQKRIMLPLSLSYDHRIIDGAEAARFSNELKENLGKNFAYKLAI